MNNVLVELLHSIVPLSDGLMNFLNGKLQTKRFAPGELLLKEGQVSSFIAFIEKGIVRSYYFKETEKLTSWFMKEGDIIISVASFFSQTPSTECIEALEHTTVHAIAYEDLQYAYIHFPEFNVHGRVLTEKYYVMSEERLHMLRKRTSKEKYQYLLDKHPDIMSRARLGDIASFIGVNLETLSRIRSDRV
jgi:CRP/FNR family transcriptional regulator, anaerobic regulatory protein